MQPDEVPERRQRRTTARRRFCSARYNLESIQGTAKKWGSSIVGFGSYHYKYASGREGDTMVIGFSPRKQNISPYIMDGFDKYQELLGKLGKHFSGKSCLYIKRLSDVDPEVLKEIMFESLKAVRKANPVA